MGIHVYLLTTLILLTATSAHVFNLNKGVIVHLFEWRWLDIAQECEEFLAPNGFAGVQISPPTENLIITDPKHMRPWWERYQPVSYKLRTRSGTEEELQEMLDRCNRVGVRVFVDVVLNHMSGPTPPNAKGTDGSAANYETFHYPGVPFTELDFHTPPCGIFMHDYGDPWKVRNCELEGLRDLDQSKTYVKRKQLELLNKLIKMGVAGFRIDAARHMWPEDLRQIYDRLDDLSVKHGFRPGTRPLIYQEVIDYGTSGEAIRYSEYTEFGLVTDFRYIGEMGDTLLGNRDLNWLREFDASANHVPSDVSLVFIDNHDTQRKPKQNELNYKTFRAYKMAIAFMLAYPWGTPQIVSGYNFDSGDQGPPHDNDYNILSPHPIENNICSNRWTCEHRWRQIYNMVHFHNVVADTEVSNWQGDGNKQLAFCRGNKGFIAFNTDPNKNLDEEFKTCLPKGKYCDVISGELVNNECKGARSKIIEVGEDGKAVIQINKFVLHDSDVEIDGVVAIHSKSKILDADEIKPKTELERWCDSNDLQIAFCDEKKGFIAFSKNEFVANQMLKTCLPTGKYCDVISGSVLNNVCSGKTVVVASDGTGILKKSPVEGEPAEEKNYKLIVLHLGAKIVEEKVNENHATYHENSQAAGSLKMETTPKDNPLTPEKMKVINSAVAKKRFWAKFSVLNKFKNFKFQSNSNTDIKKNPICQKLEELITKRDGSLTLSTFVSKDDEDFEIMKMLSDTGKEFLVGDLLSLIK